MNLFNISIKYFDNLIYGLLSMIFIVFSIGSLIATGAMTMPEPNVTYETVLYHFDNIIVNFIFIFVVFFLLKSKRISLKKLNMKYLCILSILVPFIIGVSWLLLARSTPNYDQWWLYNYSQEFNKGNFSILEEQFGYFERCPNQLIMTFFYQGLMKILGTNLLRWQIINLVSTLISFLFLEKITHQLFNNENVTKISMILIICFLPPVLFSTFFYGTMLGLMFSILALSFTISYLQTNKILYLPLILLLMVLSYLAKVNYLITIIAMAMVLFAHTIQKRNIYSMLTCILLIAIIPSVNNVVYSYYESKADFIVKDSFSTMSRLAVGLQEGPYGPGWWNTYGNDIYYQCEADKACQDALAKEYVSGQINNFITHPTYFISFMGRKMLSAWGDPSYQSLHISQSFYPSTNPILDSAYRWKIHDAIFLIGDIYQIILYFSFGISCLFLIIRKQSSAHFLLPLTIFGSFAYYFLFEIKGIYLIPVVILMIPFSAYGLAKISSFLRNKPSLESENEKI